MQASKSLNRVCIIPHVFGVGGMVSFQAKIITGLAKRGIQVTFDPADEPFDAVLIIGGTRQLVALRKMGRQGIPIVQRLDGINWLHRHLRTGIRHWLRAEVNNWLLAYIRERIATRIVYQSRFVEEWWKRLHGGKANRTFVIHNGVDLDLFNPKGPPIARNPIRLLMVEGNLQGGYELGLESAVALAGNLLEQNKPVELVIAGQVDENVKKKWGTQSNLKIEWVGVIPNDKLPDLYRSANLFYSGDINAACPNSVIEAMASGLPVLAFDTGALSELVSPKAGRVVPYGGDPWKLEPPNIAALADGAKEILSNQESLRAGARAGAEEKFGLDAMVDAYIEALSG